MNRELRNLRSTLVSQHGDSQNLGAPIIPTGSAVQVPSRIVVPRAVQVPRARGRGRGARGRRGLSQRGGGRGSTIGPVGGPPEVQRNASTETLPPEVQRDPSPENPQDTSTFSRPYVQIIQPMEHVQINQTFSRPFVQNNQQPDHGQLNQEALRNDLRTLRPQPSTSRHIVQPSTSRHIELDLHPSSNSLHNFQQTNPYSIHHLHTYSPRLHSITDMRGTWPTYDGENASDYDTWWQDIDAQLKLYNLTESDKINKVNSCLKGKARNYVSSVNIRQMHCLQDLDDLLRKVFDKTDWYQKLVSSKQEDNEPIRDFAVRLSITAKRCNLAEVAVEKICMHTFKKNSVPHIQKLLANLLPSVKFDDAVLHAVKYDESGIFAHGEDRKTNKRKIEDVMIMNSQTVEIENPELEDSQLEQFENQKPELVAKISTKIAKSFESQLCNFNAKLDALHRKLYGEDPNQNSIPCQE